MLALVVDSHVAVDAFVIVLVLAAGLESIFGYCLGCTVFGWLMRIGLVPETICAECADVSGRLAGSGRA